jgi:hypothetical protein
MSLAPGGSDFDIRENRFTDQQRPGYWGLQRVGEAGHARGEEWHLWDRRSDRRLIIPVEAGWEEAEAKFPRPDKVDL